MSDLETALARKRAELERLFSEYTRHLNMAHETFVDITCEMESCKAYRVEGMALVLEVVPRFNRVVKEFTAVATNASASRQAQN